MHEKRFRVLSTILFLLVLAGCNQKQDPQIATLETRLASLEQQVKAVKSEVELDKLFKNIENVAYMTPGESGYVLVKSDISVLTVALTNVAPYASGSKVALQFGNLSSATIDGLKAKVEWGPVEKDGTPKNEEAKSREITLSESLNAGSWNTTELVLEGVPPSELGFVRLRGVGHRAIRLRGK